MDEDRLSQVRRLIRDSRQRIAAADAAVMETQKALAEMRERLERDRQQTDEFKKLLEKWREPSE